MKNNIYIYKYTLTSLGNSHATLQTYNVLNEVVKCTVGGNS